MSRYISSALLHLNFHQPRPETLKLCLIVPKIHQPQVALHQEIARDGMGSCESIGKLWLSILMLYPTLNTQMKMPHQWNRLEQMKAGFRCTLSFAFADMRFGRLTGRIWHRHGCKVNIRGACRRRPAWTDQIVQDIDLVHCRISSIPALDLGRFTKLEV